MLLERQGLAGRDGKREYRGEPMVAVARPELSNNQKDMEGKMDRIKTKRHLLAAVSTLGAVEGTVGQRLRMAYDRHLRGLPPNADLPESVRGDYESLLRELARLFVDVEQVEERVAAPLAKRVVALYDRVSKAY